MSIYRHNVNEKKKSRLAEFLPQNRANLLERRKILTYKPLAIIAAWVKGKSFDNLYSGTS